MSFESLFKYHGVEKDFECFSEDFFSKNNIDSIKMSLNQFIDDEVTKELLLRDILSLKSNSAKPNVIQPKLNSFILRALSGEILSKTKLTNCVRDLIKKEGVVLVSNAEVILSELKKLVKDGSVNEEIKGKSKFYSLRSASQSNEKENDLNDVNIEKSSLKQTDDSYRLEDQTDDSYRLEDQIDNSKLEDQIDNSKLENQVNDKSKDQTNLAIKNLSFEVIFNDDPSTSQKAPAIMVEHQFEVTKRVNMEKLFEDQFNTNELKSIYSDLPAKLIYKDLASIKTKLKESVEEKISREAYKRIYQSVFSIKKQLSRSKLENNVMISVDTLESCLPSSQLSQDVLLKDKFRFVKKFIETLKSKVEKKEFKKHDQYERIAGWLVGRIPNLKMSGDGTTKIKKRIQSSIKNEKEKVQIVEVPPKLSKRPIEKEAGSSDEELY